VHLQCKFSLLNVIFSLNPEDFVQQEDHIGMEVVQNRRPTLLGDFDKSLSMSIWAT